MSLNVNPLKISAVRYPPTDINEYREYSILKGGSNFAIRVGTTTSFSNVNATFSLPPANPETIYDRHVYLKQPVTLTFNGTCPSGTNLLLDQRDAFRAFPLSSCMSNLAVKINNTQNSVVLKDGIHAFMRYHNGDESRQIDYSMTPTMLDNVQNYSDGALSNRNVLGQYKTDSFDFSRGAFPYSSVVQTPADASGNATSVVSATLTEPLFLSPLLFGRDQGPGLVGIQTFEVVVTWGDLSRLWSHDASGNNITSITVNLSQPTLLIQQIIPQDLQLIPKRSIYSYFELANYSNNYGRALNPNEFITTNGPNVQLGSIPRKVYIFAKKQNSGLTITDTDTFLSISSISINWNGKDGLLSSCSQQDLYNISKANGCDMSYADWIGKTQGLTISGPTNSYGLAGSVLCLNFGEQIGLESYQAPGLLGTFQFQVTNIGLTNVNSTKSIQPELWYWFVNEGTFNVMNNTSLSQIGVISKMDVLNSANAPIVSYKAAKHIHGANFLDDLKSVGRDVWSGVKSAIKEVKEPVKDIGEMYRSFQGRGDDSDEEGGVLVGGARMHRRKMLHRLRR